MADSTATLNEISGALDNFAESVRNSESGVGTMMETRGWNFPGMNFEDLADYIRTPKSQIKNILDNLAEFNDVDFDRLQQFPARIQYLQANILQYLPGGNAGGAFVAIDGVIKSLMLLLDKYTSKPLELKAVEDRTILPAEQIQKLRKIEKAIIRLESLKGDLDSKIAKINSAHDTAEALPADIQALDEARTKYEEAVKNLSVSLESTSKTSSKIEDLYTSLSARQSEAVTVLLKANSAYSASTTIGLGAAFADRAKSLTISTILLGAVLLVALTCAGWITYTRVEFVHKLMLKPNISYGLLWINVTFTALSVSAPVWAAWLITKQIGQRFRMAEDYGYKASVAKAYEGYRKEASQIDEELAKRLFSIALDKLSEGPIRLIEKENPGSPVHDMNDGMKGIIPSKIEIPTP